MMKYLIYVMSIIFIVSIWSCGEEKSNEIVKDSKPQAQELIERDRSGEDPDSVLMVINDKLALTPKDASLYQERAYHLFNTRGKRKQDTTKADAIEESIRDIKRAIEIDPENPEYYFSKGYFFHATLQLDEARTAFEQAIEKDPEYQDAYYFLAKIYFILGNPADRDKFNYDKSRDMINKSLEIDATHIESYFLRGLVYMELGDSGAALNSFKTITDIDPKHYDAYIQQGMLYATKGNSKAEVVFRQALEIKPNSTEARFALARFQQEIGKYDEAEANYIRTVEIDSFYSIAYLNLGYMYMTYDTAFSKALKYLHKAVYFNPGSFLALTYFNIATVYELKGNTDQATIYYKQTLKVDNDYLDAAKALERIERGILLKR